MFFGGRTYTWMPCMYCWRLGESCGWNLSIESAGDLADHRPLRRLQLVNVQWCVLLLRTDGQCAELPVQISSPQWFHLNTLSSNCSYVTVGFIIVIIIDIVIVIIVCFIISVSFIDWLWLRIITCSCIQGASAWNFCLPWFQTPSFLTAFRSVRLSHDFSSSISVTECLHTLTLRLVHPKQTGLMTELWWWTMMIDLYVFLMIGNYWLYLCIMTMMFLLAVIWQTRLVTLNPFDDAHLLL